MISISHLKHTRKNFRLSIPELTLTPGITILVGKNGAGKSTFLQLLATALKPQQGTIEYGGKTTDKSLPFIRKHIGFLPTGIELYDEMKVSRFLTYMCELKGVSNPQAVDQSIVALSIENLKRNKIKTLSQGMKQRIGIAQALLDCPPMLLLDEPLNYLDSHERKNVVSLLSRYAGNKLVVIATHELNEWEELADDVIWLHEGKMLYHGSINCWKNQLPDRIWQGKVLPEKMALLDQDRIIHIKRRDGSIFLKYMHPSKPFEHFTEIPPRIEDAYFIRKKAWENGR
ncbi:ATP-binding cassette domain-containing protein [Pseudalkalibacillus hwajinpoensis]|uniref:ABC transporter ATP-binding protein n=1 Tax=Guptibacillus hwajinpoensis TaxID=208199 RepID=UPI00325C3029